MEVVFDRTKWNGREFSYVPPQSLAVHESVVLHTDVSEALDPITYQVLRSRFWHINIEHGDTLKRVSGSPVIVWGDDFNTCILTENGDTVVSGPSVQYFTGCADLAVKWTLENRSESPGISDGDIFLQNDPYIAAPHQIDTSTYAPVFWQGGLFCWVFNQCHVGDIGGVDAGSFCVNARDIFDDPLPFPPVKLVSKGRLQADILDLFSRQSRMPDMINLQIRSQIAGLQATRNRIIATIEKYGAGVVKCAMRRMISDCSNAVGRRLSRIPDGEWTELVFTAGVGPSDRKVHREVTRVRKIGDRIICSNEGTDPQSLAGNSTYSSWRSALISAVSALLAADQMYCPGGVVEHMEFIPTPGTRNVAQYPAAISALTSTLVSVNVAYLVISKMLLSGPPELRRVANAAGGFSTPGWWVGMGLDRHGKFVADTTADAVFGAIGAFGARDGVDTGGAWWFPRPLAANAEEWETALPILYLYRRERTGSGGAGHYRGGNGAEIAIVGHKTKNLEIQIVSTDPAANASHGLAGGLPGHSGNHRYAASTLIQECMKQGDLPSNDEALLVALGSFERVGPKSKNRLTPDDVLIISFCAGGGVGDPLTRPSDEVLKDFLRGAITAERAEKQWGVVIAGGAVDTAATSARREERVARRLQSKPVGTLLQERLKSSCATVNSVAPGLAAVHEDDGSFWGCDSCGRLLTSLQLNYKSGTLLDERELQDFDPSNYPRISDFSDGDVVGRAYYCPGCAAQLSFDVCLRGDNHFWDCKLL